MTRENRRKTRASIGIESLEGRKLLSTSTHQIAPTTASLIKGNSYLLLKGMAHGTVSRPLGIPDLPSQVNLQGTGNIHGVGTAKVTGSIYGLGFISAGHVGGTLTLTTGKGSLTLQLVGPVVGGNTPAPSGTYSYSVLEGTGTLKHDLSNGSIALTLGAKSFSITFHGKPKMA